MKHRSMTILRAGMLLLSQGALPAGDRYLDVSGVAGEAYNDYARQQRMARSPRRPAVKGVSGGAPESRAEDPFLRGFNAAW